MYPMSIWFRFIEKKNRIRYLKLLLFILQNKENIPPTVPRANADYPPAIPSTSFADVSGGRAPVEATNKKRRLQDDSPKNNKKMVGLISFCINIIYFLIFNIKY